MHWKLRSLWTGFRRIFVLAAISFVLAGHPFKTTTPNMSVVHILLVSFKPSAPKATVDSICKRIIAFKEACLDSHGNPYVIATSGGINNSPEDSNKNMTHGFIIEFKNDADRRYFLNVDQAHKDFVDHIDPNNNDFLTLDFTPGIYHS